ncbi:hypothetical protein PAPHI01_1360 [Pancytospora philotis]|nr:hypothetical protein PAPHI01_1360 [Pancytospora philotis]
MRVRVRQLLKLFALQGVFVSAHLSTTDIIGALEEEYGAGEYVDPEGPLNIMRGHPCVSNGMIAKQRKYAAPMRLAYSCTGDGSRGDRAYTRNAHEDEVRELPGDSEAVVYLSAHYRILKSMFTIENDVVVVDRSPEAPFCRLYEREREKCVELFAALLVLAGGGDIRLRINSDISKPVASLTAYGADVSARVLGLESADSATLAAVKFFVEYGGNNASQAAGYGLHYTDSPGFLIQAYICEFIEGKEDVVCIFKAAKEIVARLSAGDPSAQLRPRFFTTDADYVYSYGENAGYFELPEAEMAFSGVQPALLESWLKLDCGNVVDPKHIVSALLKLCYCLSTNPAVDRWNNCMLRTRKQRLRGAFLECVRQAFEAPCSFNRTGVCPIGLQIDLRRNYKIFLSAARASERVTVTGYSSENFSTVPATDPKDFLVVLARALGEPEETLQALQQLLMEALGDNGSASSYLEISIRVDQMLRKFLSVQARPCFDVCTASDGARYGVLWLSLWPDYDDARGHYALKLAFKPEKVEVMYLSQQIRLVGERRRRLVAALKNQDTPYKSVRGSAHAATEESCGPTLCSLVQESLERCLDPAAHRVLADAHIAEACAAEDPLACHIAVSRWMAYTPLQSLGQAVKAGDRLLPTLEGLLAQSTGGGDSAQWVLTADSPVVVVLDNILGSAAVADATLRSFIAGGLRRRVGGRTDLFPSIFLPTATSSSQMQEMDDSAYADFIACLTKCDTFEMLVRRAELQARDIIQAAGNVQGPWGSEVCAAVARCFKLRYENSIRGYCGETPDVCYYKQQSAFIDAAGRAKAVQAAVIKAADARAEAAQAAAVQAEPVQAEAARVAAAQAAGGVEFLKKSNFCADAANLCAAAAECFTRRHENSILSLGGDTFDTCYYRHSVFALIAAAADPAMYSKYCDMLRDIWAHWDDTYSVIEMYALLRKTFRKLPRPAPLSPELVADVFSNGPAAEQIKSLLRVFVIFAQTDRDYCGLCSVFAHYQRLLRPEYACELVELLKRRDDAHRRALSKITFHNKIWFDEGHALPYSAFRDLLVDCVENDAVSGHTLLERVRELLEVKDIPRESDLPEVSPCLSAESMS